MDPLFITLTVLVLLFSVILHEVMHGLVALKFGDHTAENAGRLTLNPLPHIDPIGTLLFPFMTFVLPMLLTGSPGFIFAWAKPVPVNPLNFSNIKMGEISVSLAGIGANLFLALISAVLFHISVAFFPNMVFLYALKQMIAINILLALFNLLPIPPLDGSRVLMALAPYNIAHQIASLEKYGFVLLILLTFTGPGRIFLDYYLGIGSWLIQILLRP